MAVVEKPPSASLGQNAPIANGILIRRLLGLGWNYRMGCVVVLTQQILLVILSLGGVGLTGLGIDYLRHVLDPNIPAPYWPLGMAPDGTLEPRDVLWRIAGAILAVAAFHSVLR